MDETQQREGKAPETAKEDVVVEHYRQAYLLHPPEKNMPEETKEVIAEQQKQEEAKQVLAQLKEPEPVSRWGTKIRQWQEETMQYYNTNELAGKHMPAIFDMLEKVREPLAMSATVKYRDCEEFFRYSPPDIWEDTTSTYSSKAKRNMDRCLKYWVETHPEYKGLGWRLSEREKRHWCFFYRNYMVIEFTWYK